MNSLRPEKFISIVGHNQNESATVYFPINNGYFNRFYTDYFMFHGPQVRVNEISGVFMAGFLSVEFQIILN